MTRNAQGQWVLKGDGRYGFDVIVDGADLVVRRARATWFGGDSDPYDSGLTASGIITKGHPDLLGCALPMDFGTIVPNTQGAPFPKIAWHAAVRVYFAESGRTVTVPLIDIGPAYPPKAHAQIDLTIAAFQILGGPHSAARRGSLTVDYRVIGGARFVKGLPRP